MNKLPVFTYHDIARLKDEESLSYFFTCAMISACEPLFDNMESNHDVQRELIKAKVIRGGSADSEYCQLFVSFNTRKAGEAFIDRLNAYLAKRAEAYNKACC